MHVLPPRTHAAVDVVNTDDVWDGNSSPGETETISHLREVKMDFNTLSSSDMQESLTTEGDFVGAINLFVRTPEGKTCCGCVPFDANVAYAVQCVFNDYDPVIHKIHSGAKCLLPQESLEAFHIESNEVLTVTCRIRGGAKPQSDEESVLLRIATFLACKTLPWKDAEKAARLLWNQAESSEKETVSQARTDGELGKQIRLIIKAHSLGMQNFFPHKDRRNTQPKLAQSRIILQDINLLPGTFVCENGEDAPITHVFQLAGRLPDDFFQIVTAGRTLYSQELSIF